MNKKIEKKSHKIQKKSKKFNNIQDGLDLV
jgi:hypothetical protein